MLTIIITTIGIGLAYQYIYPFPMDLSFRLVNILQIANGLNASLLIISIMFINRSRFLRIPCGVRKALVVQERYSLVIMVIVTVTFIILAFYEHFEQHIVVSVAIFPFIWLSILNYIALKKTNIKKN